MLKDFKAFIMRGTVVDMAVGIIVGAAFGTIVNSLVKDVIMPPIGLALGKVDFANLFVVLHEGKTPGPYASLAAAQTAGAVELSPARGVVAAHLVEDDHDHQLDRTCFAVGADCRGRPGEQRLDGDRRRGGPVPGHDRRRRDDLLDQGQRADRLGRTHAH